MLSSPRRCEPPKSSLYFCLVWPIPSGLMDQRRSIHRSIYHRFDQTVPMGQLADQTYLVERESSLMNCIELWITPGQAVITRTPDSFECKPSCSRWLSVRCGGIRPLAVENEGLADK
ncbi:hypothetical protein RRG08_012947 [Elysia crispata]|uniref:Uncharacterized protein n=1 Tax=Elysia crispata TaxID=231223 RepID=A0AAE0ZZS6_9GAST|nr:hypothetical protein RRG08_012947 [Elysia crispata]